MTNLADRIFTTIAEECKLEDEALVRTYFMNRKQQIIMEHEKNVFPIKAPGERGGDKKYWLTKLHPDSRNHDGKLRASSREALEEKIIAHYLALNSKKALSVREAVKLSYGNSESDTMKRTLQRLSKYFPTLADVQVSRLTEKSVRDALDAIDTTAMKTKEFQQALTPLNLCSDYCRFNHIECVDIRKIIRDWKTFNIRGKKAFATSSKTTNEIAFAKSETMTILRYALEHPNEKILFVAILLTTGLRIGELLALDVSNVHLDVRKIEITQEINIHTGKFDTPKENLYRTVFLSPVAVKVFETVFELRKELGVKTPRLMSNKLAGDGHMHYTDMCKYMKGTLHKKVLGYDGFIPKRSPHDCRRTYASLEYIAGTPLNIIQGQLGHSSPAQTWEYIKDIVEESERVDKLRGVVDEWWTNENAI